MVMRYIPLLALLHGVFVFEHGVWGREMALAFAGKWEALRAWVGSFTEME